mmetsp:Transcript_74782/g.173204  ORF Transcript_74782/g.173204 Transcript_74782/m.173204 type:complete len:277 (+) Transcript_74782:60-890(+)
MSQLGDGDDGEALMPHSHAVLGLKVADAAEEETVKRVAGAVLGLIVLLVVHFIVHVCHHGHVSQAFLHLLTAAILPAVGYLALALRSTKAAWIFHLMTVISSVIHAVMLVAVLMHLLQLEAAGFSSQCAGFARPCQKNTTGSWQCHGGYCIEASRHCDGVVNCFDGSDEVGCIDAAALTHDGLLERPTAPPLKPGKALQECALMHSRWRHAPKLRWWWFLMSLPMWGLCLFAAYHSLEFYVQLRVRRLSARVDRASADATVFDRAEVDRQADDMAE